MAEDLDIPDVMWCQTCHRFVAIEQLAAHIVLIPRAHCVLVDPLGIDESRVLDEAWQSIPLADRISSVMGEQP